MKRIIGGWEFGAALVKAGVIPENCGDLIIEVSVAGPVIIHTKMFCDERLFEVVPTTIDEFKIVDVKEPKE